MILFTKRGLNLGGVSFCLSVSLSLLMVFWIAGLTAAQASEMASNNKSDERPNIVIILADDLGWGDVGYHGSDIQTPHIDRLAKEGAKLNRFYATPFCSPTRAALMTGRDPLKLGVAYSVLMPWENGPRA